MTLTREQLAAMPSIDDYTRAKMEELMAERDEARAEVERVLRIGKGFQEEARNTFAQSCANLARAEKAEREAYDRGFREARDAALAIIRETPFAAGTLVGAKQADMRRRMEERVAALVPSAERAEPAPAKREWHGCADPRGHKLVEGVCEVEGCGLDLRDAEPAPVCATCGDTGFVDNEPCPYGQHTGHARGGR